MRLTQLFVNRPPLVFVLVAVVALAGCFALATLVQQNTPNIDFPVVSVSASYPGAPPSELRDSVVRPIEDAIAGAPNIRSHQHLDPAEPGDDQHVLHARLESNDRPHRSARSRADRARRVTIGSAGADGAHVRPRASDDHHAVGHFAIAEHRGSLGHRHQYDRPGIGTSAGRLECERQWHRRRRRSK